MSRKEVENSQVRFTRARPEPEPRGKTTFLDGINVSKQDKTKDSVSIAYVIGAAISDDEQRAFAKKVINPSGVTTFYVKFATAGSNTGRMLNPWGLFYQEGDESRYEKQMGRYRYEYQKVSEGVFNSYLHFLKTRSERHLLHAEREAVNG